jgi:hypothetical protein
VEENQRSGRDPWSVRQTGIYHYHSATDRFDFYLVLNPYYAEECVLEQQLRHFTDSKAKRESLLENPYRLHLFPFAAYVDNWRWCFRHLGKEFSKMVDTSVR